MMARHVAALLLPLAGPLAAQRGPPVSPTRSTVYAPQGIIATSQPLATSAGLSVLERGGNAVDAAVTAAGVLAVVEPHMTGVGGDVFAQVWVAKDRRLVGLNASGRAGSLMTREELVRRGRREVPLNGAEPITVPGAVSGWAALLERYGTITLADALGPAIQLAEEGFPVSPVIAGEWALETEKLKQDEGARATFLVNGARAPRAGEWFRNPDLARTLQLLAAQGPAGLYGGELGQRIVTRLKDLGGFLTLDDLKRQKADWVEPISATFKGYRVWELPPNGQGVAVLEMLKILEPMDLRSLGHNTAPYLHQLIEAKKLAFADLSRYVGDPAFLTAPPAALLTDAFIQSRRARIDPKHAAERADPGEAVSRSETVYLSAADKYGNMISFINSNFEQFGSGVVVPGTGFALQDRGAGFTLTEGLPNTVAPGKRPFHTLIPGFVTRPESGGEAPWLSFGVMGGSSQPQGQVQVLLNLLVFDMDLQQAIDAARFRHLDGKRVGLEVGIGEDARRGLSGLGHVIVGSDTLVTFGGAQAVRRLERGWAGASDPRKDGMAAGY